MSNVTGMPMRKNCSTSSRSAQIESRCAFEVAITASATSPDSIAAPSDSSNCAWSRASSPPEDSIST